MKRLLKMEVYEFKHDYICLLMLGITFIYGIFSSSSYMANDYFNLPEGGYRVLIAMLYDSTAFIILYSVFAALLIGRCFTNRTIITKVMVGKSRRDVILSKAISIIIISIVSLMILPIIGAFLVTIKYGWNVPVIKSIESLTKIIICTVLLEAGIFSIVIFLGVIFRDTLRTVTASAIVIFTNALYISYAKALKLPVAMHPLNLLRTILGNNSTYGFITFSLEGIILLGVTLMLSINIFCKCELK